MTTDRDPFFIACAHADHEGYINEPDYTLVDINGKLCLRTGEQIIKTIKGNFVMLRYPEQMWYIQQEKIQNWEIIFTTERVVGIHNVLFPNAFETLDWIEEYGKFAGLHPSEEIEISEFFHWVGQKDKKLRNFSLVFQLAYTRISSVSCIKMMTTDPTGIEFWYEDGPNGSQTLVQIYPTDLKITGREIFDIGVMIQGSVLKEKEKCIKKKHELDPSWEAEDYNTHLASIQRLVRAPDFLAMGSPGIEDESYNPISFQPHPVQWCNEVFERSMDGTEPIRIIDLKY